MNIHKAPTVGQKAERMSLSYVMQHIRSRRAHKILFTHAPTKTPKIIKTMIKSILSLSDIYAFAEVPIFSLGGDNLPTIALTVVKKDGASTDPAYA